MLLSYLRDFSQPRSRASRRGSTRTRRSRPFAFRPDLEFLERRQTPTGNIAITNAFLVNSSDQPLSSVTAGQGVYIQANFTTQGLPAGASYRVAYDLNGFTRDTGYITFGAGLASGSWYYYLGTFIPSPGVNQVTVTVDPDQSVPETSYADNTRNFSFTAGPPAAGSSLSYTVSQIRAAYGLDDIPDFGSAAPDGTGQTIAIVDAYNDPTILSDLDGFDQAMNLTTDSSPTLYQQYGPASSVLTVYNQAGTDITSQIGNSGQGAVPPVDPTGGWEGEETLDVEWAHAIAPGAHIDLIECNGGANFDGLFSGAATAALLPGVTAVSMSWIWNEGNWSGSNGAGELAYDSSTFVTPSGHPGITFLSSSGDGGYPGGYPAYSPNVVAVGGTQLTLTQSATGADSVAETAWSFPTPRVLAYGGGSYSQAGTWTVQPVGYLGSSATAAAGSASTATWTTSIASSDQGWVGGTEVSATWTASAGNATNATYRIYDGTAATGTLLGTVTVNQTIPPAGTAVGGAQFQELGDYYPQSGTLTVVLRANSANGTVVADSVGIAPAWATGGGESRYEPEPAYQLTTQSTGSRTIPDVSFDGSDYSGVTCYQNGGVGYDYFGTSLSSPCWAGLIAIVNQGRVAAGGVPLNSPANPMQTLQALYSLPAGDFNDITSGYNGLFAGPGYDELTGRGTPTAAVVAGLVAWQPVSVGPAALPADTVGVPYDQTVTATGGGSSSLQYIYTINSGAIPPGLTFTDTPAGLVISGTPTAVGSVTFTVDATDAYGSPGSRTYTLTINPADVTGQVGVTESGLVYNRATQLFGGTITVTDTGTTALVGTLEFELAGLPAGVTLADASGIGADGNPYITVALPSGTLAPGQSFNFTALFSDPNKSSFAYSIFSFDENAGG